MTGDVSETSLKYEDYFEGCSVISGAFYRLALWTSHNAGEV